MSFAGMPALVNSAFTTEHLILFLFLLMNLLKCSVPTIANKDIL